jgi:hypothetical protein
MAVTIGRVGASPTLDDPQSIDFDGERLRVAGLHRAATVVDAMVLRDQLRGLAGNVDEPVVPVLFTDSSLDALEGLYRIDAVQVRMSETDAAFGDVSWQLQATRVVSYQAPVLESRLVAGWLSNAHTLSSTVVRMEWAVPVPTTEVFPQTTTTHTGTLTTGDGGSITYLHYNPPAVAPSPLGTSGVGSIQWTTTLAAYYSGSCIVTVNGATVVGRQAVDTPTSWRLSNGLVRVDAAASGTWDISWWTGSAWSTAKSFRPFSFVGNNSTAFAHMSVVRNSPEAATIRLGVTNTNGFTLTADLTIRRGSRWVTVNLTGFEENWGVRRTSAEAATAVTGGLRATSNDAAGNRYLIASHLPYTQDLVNGATWATTDTTRALFGIGCEVGGSGASAPFTASDQFLRWFCPVWETVTVVGR